MIRDLLLALKLDSVVPGLTRFEVSIKFLVVVCLIAGGPNASLRLGSIRKYRVHQAVVKDDITLVDAGVWLDGGGVDGRIEMGLFWHARPIEFLRAGADNDNVRLDQLDPLSTCRTVAAVMSHLE